MQKKLENILQILTLFLPPFASKTKLPDFANNRLKKGISKIWFVLHNNIPYFC